MRPRDADRVLLDLVELLEERVDQRPWRARAACLGLPPSIWFPARGDHDTRDRAMQVCAGCPVRGECLDANLGKKEGVYGATSGKVRRRVRSQRLAVAS